MPGTKNDFGQMYDHELNPLKGWVGDRGMALEKVLPVSGGNNEVYAGCVVHVNSSNQFQLGVVETNVLTYCRVPCFAFQNESDFDVNSDLGNISGGYLMALCCLGDFELESTEFATGQTYVPGTYLTADDAGANATGELTPGTLSTHVIVGIVSQTGSNSNGSFPNEHGQNFLRFWTWFLPETIEAATT
jgi:hypothetical protein